MARIERLRKTPWWKLAALAVAAIITISALFNVFFGCLVKDHEWQTHLKELHHYDEVYYGDLIRRYPLGYVLWMKDHLSLAAPPIVRGLQGFKINWPSGGPITLGPKTLAFRLPTIVDSHENVIESMTVIAPREKGFKRQFLRDSDSAFELWLEILASEPDYVIAVAGFRPVQR